MLFVGVTTGGSVINRLFPIWAEILGIAPARLRGVDLPLDVAPGRVRDTVRQIADDPSVRGALVTTHKIAVHRHAGDLFDSFDRYAGLLGEVSAISKSGGRLIGHAKDPITAGLALDRIVPAGHWRRYTEARALVMGSGGAGLALAAHLLERDAGDGPKDILLTDVDRGRVESARRHLAEFATRRSTEIAAVAGAPDQDTALHALPAGSLVVNATGLGKDRPGSPIGDAARFPDHGLVWEFNYRGPRDFLEQARRQAPDRRLTVADGWVYFLHGWAHVIAEVFDLGLDEALLARLEHAADPLR